MTNDEKFNSIWNDKDCQNVMKFVVSRFNGLFDEDDSIEIRMDAVRKYLSSKIYPNKATASLFTIARRECILRLRNRSTKKVSMLQYTDTLDFVSTDDCQHDKVVVAEESEIVLSCMALLDENERKLIEQYYLCEMTYEEIGRANEYTKQHAHKCVRKALNKLKRLVGV